MIFIFIIDQHHLYHYSTPFLSRNLSLSLTTILIMITAVSTKLSIIIITTGMCILRRPPRQVLMLEHLLLERWRPTSFRIASFILIFLKKCSNFHWKEIYIHSQYILQQVLFMALGFFPFLFQDTGKNICQYLRSAYSDSLLDLDKTSLPTHINIELHIWASD